jgi:uncharacterized RDD family membrane protein YckC
MTTRRRDLTNQKSPLLFDLPLEAEPAAEADRVIEPATASDPFTAAIALSPEGAQEELFHEELAPDAAGAPMAEELVDPEPRTTEEMPTEEVPARVPARLISGAADLVVHSGVLAGVSLGLYAMAIEPQPWQWPGLLVLLLAFSFVYTVVSLSFWGQTAGMAWCELTSRDRLERPLSFRQATLRWAGSLLTVALAGLPAILSFRGTSLTDLISGSITLQQIAVDA